MSCVILNTTELCITPAQRDTSGEKSAVIHGGGVNFERREGGQLYIFSLSFMSHFMRPVISCTHSVQ